MLRFKAMDSVHAILGGIGIIGNSRRNAPAISQPSLTRQLDPRAA